MMLADPLAGFELTDKQRQAATETERDVLVTAGAGTGKTRTLVARYVYLLWTGLTERQVAAITFTEKAAREMRNRIRQAVAQLAVESGGEEQLRWREIESHMDAARIGTIHSLAAEIMRAHPAEAQIDPGFVVVDEGLSLTYKARAVDDAMAWAARDPEASQLFLAFSTARLATILSRLLDFRLEAQPLLGPGTGTDLWSYVRTEIERFLAQEAIEQGVATLKELESGGELLDDAGPSLGPRAERFLHLWSELEQALSADDVLLACETLFTMRRECLQKVGGSKKGAARPVMFQLQDLYDEHLNPWLGGAKAKDSPPSIETDTAWGEHLPRLVSVFEQASAAYRRSLDSRRALDFDDLEAGALNLLKRDDISRIWRERLRAVLVDEFQDTNERQRRIIDAIIGDRSGKLFAVGDARQSIYRFRGADVRVFRRKRYEVQESGGFVPSIDLSFRAHAPLLVTLDQFVGPLMGVEDSEQLHRVPYTSLIPNRKDPKSPGPHFEIVMGTGEGADSARIAGARALAARLADLKKGGAIEDWSEVALLFRSSRAFEAYEGALEEARIPFVTVAGRGFYERPEIRDVINALQAITDPSDDLALAGFLRSPAVGVSDPGIFRLRGPDRRPLRSALADADQYLDGEDLVYASRAHDVLEELHSLVDRLPVAELISALVDRLHWRGVLASSHARLWRNLDKLVDDAQVSELVNVSAFLEYLSALRDVGARESEAVAGERGALQLMSIHKAKGLEFDLVVLADASRTRPGTSQPVYLLDEIGAAAVMDRFDEPPLAYRLARALDADQSRAEENRLLYVAATRARERLILSGHLSQTRGGYSAAGWMKDTLELFNLEPNQLAEQAGQEALVDLPDREKLRVWVARGDEIASAGRVGAASAWPDSNDPPLFHVASVSRREDVDAEMVEEPERTWRATGTERQAPAIAVGRMVHAAIQRRAIAEGEAQYRFLENEGFREGLIDDRQREAAILESAELLSRLSKHPLWEEVTSAGAVQHEIPFTTSDREGVVQSGQIDLLWQVDGEWKLVDFKTDTLLDKDDLAEAVRRHRAQVERYIRSAESILGETPTGMLCFLDSRGEIELIDI